MSGGEPTGWCAGHSPRAAVPVRCRRNIAARPTATTTAVPAARSAAPLEALPVRPEEDPWTPSELEEVRAELQEERDRGGGEASALVGGQAEQDAHFDREVGRVCVEEACDARERVR